jgi:hypothetical protein
MMVQYLRGCGEIIRLVMGRLRFMFQPYVETILVWK